MDDSIPKQDYFASYQVALVLAAGSCAARFNSLCTSLGDRHSGDVARLCLPRVEYKKIFGDVLETNANYDPVLATLHDLNKTLHWIRRHPAEVNARQEAVVFLVASRTSKLLEFYMYTNIMLSSHFTFLIESYID